MSGEMIGWTVLAATVNSGLYVIVCRIWPWTSCRRCKGGRKYAPFSSKHWRDCGKCKGTGRRVRLGRKFWTWASARGHDAVG